MTVEHDVQGQVPRQAQMVLDASEMAFAHDGLSSGLVLLPARDGYRSEVQDMERRK